jgi:hypothetical protein
MQGNMLKVSLGFSEFVSQLMYETFDAVMDSQFYQLEKYNDLSEALYMPDDLFKQKYIGNDEFNSFLEKTLGFWPKEGMIIDEKTKSMLVEIIGRDGLDEISKDGNLTGTVLSKLILFCTSKIVEEKKSSLRLFLINKGMSSLK